MTRASARSAVAFTYDEMWRNNPTAYALSLPLPIAGRRFTGVTVSRYLRGLLPDDPPRLRRLAAQYGVDASDHYALLAHVGEDCPGAVQFVRPDRLDQVLDESKAPSDIIHWITEAELAQQIRSLAAENAGEAPSVEEGQFSLPGALAKVALRWDAGRQQWGRPIGRAASTHIIKPPRAIPFHAENEHLCLALAREVGLQAATTEVLHVQGETALVVTRYDRAIGENDRIVRLHQEDMSQALGADPDLKYANEGAPTIAQLVRLLQTWASDGTEQALRLLEAVAFNWAIIGTDAHPRNYSVLISPGTEVALAPLYDLASACFLHRGANPRTPQEELPLAMAVDGVRLVGLITRRHWEGEAKRAGLRSELVVARVEALVEAIPAAAERVHTRAVEDGIDPTFASRFARDISAWSSRCRAALA